jgi:hypothetical protein
MSKSSSKNQNKPEPKTIIQKLMDRKKEELLENMNITNDISCNTVLDLSNNIQLQPNIEPLIENTIVDKTNELLLKNKIELLQKIRKNCIRLKIFLYIFKYKSS